MNSSSRLGFGLFLIACTALQSTALGIYPVTGGIPPPSGYDRISCPQGSYGEWLRSLPLKRDKVIRLHDGNTLGRNGYAILAVVDLPLMFKDDLEQCADFAMRLWAEYHRDRGLLDTLFLPDYGGKPVAFSTSDLSYLRFLRKTFANSNSFSLLRGCDEIPASETAPGDMFVQNRRGGIGHVSVILDSARNSEGRTVHLIGFSFMPAQEFHLEKADPRHGPQGWFTVDGFHRLLKEQYDYGEPRLRRFREK